jgi:homoserine kinase
MRSRTLHLALPATSANLGPAFDAAALAFDLSLQFTAQPSRRYTIKARGRDADICGKVDNHLILTTYREVLSRAAKPEIPLALRIHNAIPIGKGCGSSAAARLAGIALAVYYGNLRWTDAQIVGEASRREHHPDNAAACWFGGLAVARMSSDREAEVARIKPKGNWPLLVAIPPDALSTEKARSVLPLQYASADVVTNIQNSMFLLAALMRGRRELLRSALADRIHQPYRAPLCPLLPAIQELQGESGVLGVALSGAGPSVLVFLNPNVPARKVSAQIAAHLQQKSLPAELFLTRIAHAGAVDTWRVRR